jgi:ribosomal protein S18 acetylase RimI-like enzyme
MVDIEQLRRCEIEYYRSFTDVVSTSYGLLFFSVDNPLSYDSNHAVILRQERGLARAVDDIVRFYREKRLVPRIYPAYQPEELPRLRPVLEEKGFVVEESPLRLFIWQGEPQGETGRALAVRRARELDNAIIELVNADGEAPWSVGVLRRHLLSPSFFLFVGYVNDAPVTMASLTTLSQGTTLSDVITHPAHRGKGHAHALLRQVVAHHRRTSRTMLYLFASDPVAIHIYEQLGFVEQEDSPPVWSAFLPKSML